MKISKVKANNHKHAFEVSTRSGDYLFPYSRVEAVPSGGDPIVKLFVDPELANEGFTFKLQSGIEDSVLMDQVLDYNSDPEYMSEMDVHNLTIAAKQRFESSGLSVREIARRMRTSPTQIYRLLDTTNHNKTMKQTLAFLRVLGFQPQIQLETRDMKAAFNDTARLVEQLNIQNQALAAAAVLKAEEDLNQLLASQAETAEELMRRFTNEVSQVANSANETARRILGKSVAGKTLGNPKSGSYRSRPKSGTYQAAEPRGAKTMGRAAARKR